MATKPFSSLREDPNSLLNVSTPSVPTVPKVDYLAPNFGFDLSQISPRFQDIYVGGMRPSSQGRPDLDALVELSNRRRRTMEEARANVDRRRQDLRDQGMLGYERPASAEAVDRYMERRLPAEQYAKLPEVSVEDVSVKQMPGIGTAVQYGPDARAVVGRYGTGSAVARTEPDPNRKIEGIPAAEWFAKKAAEQGESNRFATAVPTGVTDKQDPWGVMPRYTGKAVVQEAMKKKKT
jgi:hypothetical protein